MQDSCTENIISIIEERIKILEHSIKANRIMEDMPHLSQEFRFGITARVMELKDLITLLRARSPK